MKGAALGASIVIVVAAACGNDSKAPAGSSGSGSSTGSVSAAKAAAGSGSAAGSSSTVPPWDWPAEVRAATEALMTAMRTGQQLEVLLRLAPTVDVAIIGSACGPALAGWRKASASELEGLAACLVGLGRDRATQRVHGYEFMPDVSAVTENGTFTFTWTHDSVGGWRVSSLVFVPPFVPGDPMPPLPAARPEPDATEAAAAASREAAQRDTADKVMSALRGGQADELHAWIAPRVALDLRDAVCTEELGPSKEASGSGLAALASCLSTLGRGARALTYLGPNKPIAVEHDRGTLTLFLGGFDRHWRVYRMGFRRPISVKTVIAPKVVWPVEVAPREEEPEDPDEGDEGDEGNEGGVVGDTNVEWAPPPPPPPPPRPR